MEKSNKSPQSLESEVGMSLVYSDRPPAPNWGDHIDLYLYPPLKEIRNLGLEVP